MSILGGYSLAKVKRTHSPVSKVHVSPWSHKIWDIDHVALATFKCWMNQTSWCFHH